jgi:hypothetical protein
MPGALDGEKFVTVTLNGNDLSIRTYCKGPSYDNNKAPTSPSILLEVGGGSAGIDLIGIQEKLMTNYTVCAYDRAGYGKSSQGPYPQSMENT